MNKAVDSEKKQVSRLNELEVKELKDSLRYVEIQLAKTKDQLRTTNKKLEASQDEVASLHQSIGRQSNITCAQVAQIEEMAKRLAEVDQAQKEVYEKNKLKLQQY